MKKKMLVILLPTLLICGGLLLLGQRQEHSEPEQPTVSAPITATLAVCGDIMSHSPQTNDAYQAATGTYSYLPCLQSVRSWTESADFTVGNFETTLNGPPYSGYPQFCAPDALAADLKTIGFDLVTTANNHCLDKGFNGLVRTLDVLDSVGLQHVGTYRTQEEYDKNQGVVLADVGGISIAFLSYTYGTNGIPVRQENNFSLNRFNTDYLAGCQTPDTAKLSKELSYAKTLNPDLIAVMIHWGIEYQTTQNAYQDQVADYLIQNGVDLILGSHSHVPQPMMTRTVTLADGTTRSGFVCYSLGNFISNQSPATVGVNYTDTTAVLNLSLTKNFETGTTTVSKASYVPLLVLNRGASAQDRYVILDVHAGMQAYEAGDASVVTPAIYTKLQYALNGCQTIFGTAYDQSQSTAPAA